MEREGTSTDQQSTGSAGRTLDVLQFLSRSSHPVPAAIIGSACGIPRSSIYSLLNLLKERRFVTYWPGDRKWSLGPAASEISADAPLFVHGLAALRTFAASSGSLSLREIAQRSGLSEATTARITALLAESDLLHEDADGRYSLGLELVSLASRVGWVDRLRIVCRPHLIRLRDATQETANLIVLDGDHALYIDQVESRYSLRHSGWVGKRVPLEGTATGSAFADRSGSHVASDVVELGVTAISRALSLTEGDAAISITAPKWRIEEFGIERARQMVDAVAREIALRCREQRS